MYNLIQEYSVSSQYYAPRGKDRMIFLGEQIAQRHLHYTDRLIGIVGDAGSGKSSLIKGMFPGLELSNDDDRINAHKIMQAKTRLEDLPDASTYHIDMRFQTAFTQMYEIVEFVRELLDRQKRVIVEHFNLLRPALEINADLLVGIGEEIIVTHPSIFGPLPESIYEMVHTSLKFRKMAHTAEDITIEILKQELQISEDLFYSSDIRNGFVLRFFEKQEIDFDFLATRIHQEIDRHLNVSYLDETHIQLGEKVIFCTGPRLHIKNTRDIKDFSLLRRWVYDEKNRNYCLVGLIGEKEHGVENRNTVYFLNRNCQ